jgi:hypothetical protein
LADALQRLPHLLSDEAAGHGVGHRALGAHTPQWRLALDEQLPTGFALRPRLPFAGDQTGPDVSLDKNAAAAPGKPLEPLPLDPVSVVDDANYAKTLQAQRNLSPEMKDGLKTFYR